MSSTFRLAGLAAPVLLVLSACAMPGAPAAAPLVGSEWRLEDLGGTGVLDRVEAQEKLGVTEGTLAEM